jgi:hypothetical protein
MLSIDGFWAYESNLVSPSLEWLKLKRGDDTLAAFPFRRDSKGRISKEELSLRIVEVAKVQLSKIDVFVSLRHSSTVAKLDRDDLWDLREKFFRLYFPDGHENYTYASSRARAREYNAFLKTPEGIRKYQEAIRETRFDYLTVESVSEGIQSGSIKVN